jgi:hypothetical protein
MSDRHLHGLPGWISDGVGVVLAVGSGLASQRAVLILTCASLVVGILYHVVVGACHLARTFADLRPPRPQPKPPVES